MGTDVRLIEGVPIPANFGIQSGGSPNTPIVVNSLTGIAYVLVKGVVTVLPGTGVPYTGATGPVNLGANLLTDTAGINFGQTTLSYYKEGTWTPTDGSGAGLSLTINSANYTRIGRLVCAISYLSYPVTASALAANVAGLPFTNNGGYVSGPAVSNSAAGVPTVSNSGGTSFNVDTINAAAGATNANLSSAYLISNFTYFT
jgi:hypothetical protein